jgi:hypothetical protein
MRPLRLRARDAERIVRVFAVENALERVDDLIQQRWS